MLKTTETAPRYVPLIVACVFIAVILLIPLKVIGYGYLPSDDALRHAAKAISGKAWSEILVLRPVVTIDIHAGWHAILSLVRHATGCGPDGLVTFSIVSLFIFFSLAALLFLRRPESWLAALLVAILSSSFVQRLLLGRPYIITMSTLAVILFTWRSFDERRSQLVREPPAPLDAQRLPSSRQEAQLPSSSRRPALTMAFAIAALVALSTWTHGLWFMFGLPLAALLLARRWRAALYIGSAIVIGITAGAAATGHPIDFMAQAASHVLQSLGTPTAARLAVGEFQPGGGDVLVVIAVLGLLGIRLIRNQKHESPFSDPVFIVAVIGWVLGFTMHRFWVDWGAPAAYIWIALEFDALFVAAIGEISWKRVILTAALGISLFAATTSDLEGRWTGALTTAYLSQDDPRQAELLPEPGGILYSADMGIFYRTFYRNPFAPWRYMVGFEPSLMPPEDLKIFQRILWNFGADEAYAPWVEKMGPRDRLVVKGPGTSAPRIPGLEWDYAATGIWIGRLPRK